jgi:hypothetical protein
MKKRTTTRGAVWAAIVFTMAAVTVPEAQARHLLPEPVPVSQAGIDAATAHHHNLEPPRSRITVIAVPSAEGFDWGDAGIGAAGGVGAVLLAGGSAFALRRSRRAAALS